MKRIALVFLFLAFAPANQVFADSKVVVELFTSQGCAKCPPANKLLSEIADNPDIIALNWHVDYWDYMGWKDTLASPENTARQEAYNEAIGEKGVYTPQAIINGQRQIVGSHKLELLQSVRSSLISNELPLTLRFEGNKNNLRVSVAGPDLEEGAIVTLVWYDSVQNVNISAGENAGKTIRYANVVRHASNIGEWTGERVAFPINLNDPNRNGADCIAILVQDGPGGPIIGAAKLLLGDIGA